jgi:hypothetical protein
MPEVPEKQSDMIKQIWFAIYGTNGSDGICRRLERLEKRPRRAWELAKDVLIVALSALVFLYGTGVLHPAV